MHTLILTQEEYQHLWDLLTNEIEYHHIERLDDTGYSEALESIKAKMESAGE